MGFLPLTLYYRKFSLLWNLTGGQNFRYHQKIIFLCSKCLQCLYTSLVSILQHFSKMFLAKASFRRTKRETYVHEDFWNFTISPSQTGQHTSPFVLCEQKVMAGQLSSLLPVIKIQQLKSYYPEGSWILFHVFFICSQCTVHINYIYFFLHEISLNESIMTWQRVLLKYL